jgi:hypothetical protein
MRVRIYVNLLVLLVTGCTARNASQVPSAVPAPFELSVEERALLADAINHFTEQWRDTTSVCLSITGSDDHRIQVDEKWRGVLRLHRAVATGAVCASYSMGMRVTVRADGGATGPTSEQLRVHRLRVRPPILIDASRAMIQLTVESGTDYEYHCMVRRTVQAPVTCELTTVTNY